MRFCGDEFRVAQPARQDRPAPTVHRLHHRDAEELVNGRGDHHVRRPQKRGIFGPFSDPAPLHDVVGEFGLGTEEFRRGQALVRSGHGQTEADSGSFQHTQGGEQVGGRLVVFPALVPDDQRSGSGMAPSTCRRI